MFRRRGRVGEGEGEPILVSSPSPEATLNPRTMDSCVLSAKDKVWRVLDCLAGEGETALMDARIWSACCWVGDGGGSTGDCACRMGNWVGDECCGKDRTGRTGEYIELGELNGPSRAGDRRGDGMGGCLDSMGEVSVD